MEHLTLSEIVKGSSMHVRDLFSLALTSNDEHARKVAAANANQYGGRRRKRMRPPTVILPRRGEIIMSFGNIRALIGSESGMIFDAHERTIKDLANSLAHTFALKTSDVRKNENDSTINTNATSSSISYDNTDPFELIFLEQILRDVCESHNRRLTIYDPIVHSALSRVTSEFLLSESSVHRLVPIKDSLQQFEMRVGSSLDCITELLMNDEDMLGLLLTEEKKAQGKGEVLEKSLHENVELLLEEYARQLKNVQHEVQYLLRKVQSKQEMVAISLDAYRNKMIRMSLTVSIASLGFATSTTVAGMYGMNLINGLENSPSAFANVVMTTSAAGAVIMAGCMAYISGSNMRRQTLRKVEEIETIDRALTNNMSALDYTIKQILENKKAMDKNEFRKSITDCQRSASITEKEVDFLFGIFDKTKDGLVHIDDFQSLKHFPEKKPNY